MDYEKYQKTLNHLKWLKESIENKQKDMCVTWISLLIQDLTNEKVILRLNEDIINL